MLNYLKRYIFQLSFCITLIIGLASCSLTNEEISTDPDFKLRFSADTVFFDTIFSEIPSITKRLRVYNDNNSAISIAAINLNEEDTPYNLTLNGQQGTSFNNTKLLSNDSLLILIEAQLNDRDNDWPYVVEDKLIFSTNGNNQEVSIFSWGQDANYIKDSILTCNTTWTQGKPYVIYDNALVDSLCTLTIEPGTRIFSHNGSQIYVKGSLIAEGTSADRIIFNNDRFDEGYRDFPGQWGGITFLPGSKNNRIRYSDIRNAEYGIWLGTPDDDDIADLILENSILENMSGAALLAFTSDLEMTNCLLNNAGDVLIGLFAGGNYSLRHNTFANYGFGLFKSQPTMYLADQLVLSDGSLIAGATSLNLQNCIIWGPSSDEIIIEQLSGNEFNISMANNLLRTTDSFYSISNNIINLDPLFIDPALYNYQLDANSPAIDAGVNLGISLDLTGNPRVEPPDIGAYEKQ